MTEHVKACPFDAPKRIWLIDGGGDVLWCNDPDPDGHGDHEFAVEYVRADTRPALNGNAELVEKVARAICYWADPVKNGTCHDNFCVGSCRAVQPEEQHFQQARAAIAALSTPHGDAK